MKVKWSNKYLTLRLLNNKVKSHIYKDKPYQISKRVVTNFPNLNFKNSNFGVW